VDVVLHLHVQNDVGQHEIRQSGWHARLYGQHVAELVGHVAREGFIRPARDHPVPGLVYQDQESAVDGLRLVAPQVFETTDAQLHALLAQAGHAARDQKEHGGHALYHALAPQVGKHLGQELQVDVGALGPQVELARNVDLACGHLLVVFPLHLHQIRLGGAHLYGIVIALVHAHFARPLAHTLYPEAVSSTPDDILILLLHLSIVLVLLLYGNTHPLVFMHCKENKSKNRCLLHYT